MKTVTVPPMPQPDPELASICVSGRFVVLCGIVDPPFQATAVVHVVVKDALWLGWPDT